ncbi:MAG: POTRA domain-containing protein, partial [Verrucomicrobiota bacterium]
MTLSTRAIRRTVAYLALSMSSFWLTSASAQNVGAPKIVKDVEVEYVGARSVSPDRILSNMSLKPGSPFSQAALENDIKNLYQSGLVENIRILSESVGSDGVRIIAVVETRASLGGISFVGNSMLSERSLESKVELEVGDPIDEAKVQEGQRSIRTLYTNRGFTEASVTYQIVTEADGVSQLIYTIDEGMKSELRDVEFVGNSVFTSRELRGLMKSKPKTILSILTKSGRLDSDQLEDDLDGIE